MKVYGVSLHNEKGLDVSYGMFSTEEKAVAYAKEKMTIVESLYQTETFLDFDGFNYVITEFEVDECKEQCVYSWFLRENGKFTPETEEDKLAWLEENANKLGFTLA